MNYKNPFEYEHATKLTPTFVRDVFIEDHNFTRFIQSNRNIFLVGERGSGKSMTLLYNSSIVQSLKAEQGETPLSLELIGIYVPCNTTLTHKREHELLGSSELAGLVSEHFLVLGIAYAIVEGLNCFSDAISDQEHITLREDLTYVIGTELPQAKNTLRSLMLFIDRESRRSQVALNALQSEEFRQTAFTFFSLIPPLLHALRQCSKFRHSHFLLLIDDAHDLNHHQKSALNSWVAYRDRALFSLKIAVADVYGYEFKTSSGGSILEGHDFLTLDLQKPFQSAGSDFGKLAKDIVERRLSTAGIKVAVEEFFPMSPEFSQDLMRCKEQARIESAKIYPDELDTKKRSDYVYKYGRVKYFRERAAQANLPPYSGFDTIAHVSTGVIRNLLMPCYWMYDSVYSRKQHESRTLTSITKIPPDIQARVLHERSEHLWRWIEFSLASSIDHCTLEDAKRIYQLLGELGNLFRRRLLKARSEPRALAFSISGMTPELEAPIMRLLHIARRAQLLYFRSGPAKDEGRREMFYVPNRMLWPVRGLDIVGQHARASLKAKDVWAAANGIPFPFEEAANVAEQEGLFNDTD